MHVFGVGQHEQTTAWRVTWVKLSKCRCYCKLRISVTSIMLSVIAAIFDPVHYSTRRTVSAVVHSSTPKTNIAVVISLQSWTRCNTRVYILRAAISDFWLPATSDSATDSNMFYFLFSAESDQKTCAFLCVSVPLSVPKTEFWGDTTFWHR